MNILNGFSVEVMPRTSAKIEDFRLLFHPQTKIYISHVEGVPIEQMIETAKKITTQGFSAVPHITARTLQSKDQFENHLYRYSREAGVMNLLLLAGGARKQYGPFKDSIDLVQSGVLEKFSFESIQFAGHPEVNLDIDPNKGSENADKALLYKQKFAERNDTKVSLVTQFGFDPLLVVKWLFRIHNLGINLPVRVGIAGPTKIQTLLKFAIACGVGNSLRVLQKKAKGISHLLTPYDPKEFIDSFSNELARQPIPLFEGIHFFPLGGILPCSEWIKSNYNNASLKEKEFATNNS